MESENIIRVLLVDDDVRVRETLSNILKSYPNIEVVGEATMVTRPSYVWDSSDRQWW